MSVQFYAPKPDSDDDNVGDDESTVLGDLVYSVVVASPDQTVASLRKLYAEIRVSGQKFTNTKVRDAADDLVAEGRLEEVRGEHKAIGYRAVSNKTSASDGGSL